jgi:hypothetical protein
MTIHDLIIIVAWSVGYFIGGVLPWLVVGWCFTYGLIATIRDVVSIIKRRRRKNVPNG